MKSLAGAQLSRQNAWHKILCMAVNRGERGTVKAASPHTLEWETLMQIVLQIFKKIPLKIHQNAISTENFIVFGGRDLAPAPMDRTVRPQPSLLDPPLRPPANNSSQFYVYVCAPFPSNRHHRSSGDCLEGKMENYQVCSVQYCVQQLYTVNCTHMNRTNSYLDWVLSHWAHFTVLRFIYCVCIILCLTVVYIACMCSIVIW